MKKVSALSAVLLVFAVASSGVAGETKGGYISHIATVNGVLLFQITDGSETGHASCNTSNRYATAKDSEHYQAILTAFQMGTQVKLGSVLGLGTCSQWSNSEDLRWIEINLRK